MSDFVYCECWENFKGNVGCKLCNNKIAELDTEVKRLRELVDNLYDFTKQMQDKKRRDPIGLQILKDRMYWRNEE